MARRFARIDEVIMLYERPCGCVSRHPNYVPDGCLYYARTHGLASPWDIVECRLCGATWTAFDARPSHRAVMNEIFGISLPD